MKINTKITILLALILLLVSCNDKVQKVEKPKYLDELVKIEFTSNEVLSNESIKLTHSKSKDSDMVIRYTVDGSPISGKSKVYSSEIKVDKKMNLKTALYKKIYVLQESLKLVFTQ